MVLLFIHVPLTYPNTTVNACVKIMLFQYYPDWFPYVCIENSILLAISTFLSIPTLDDQELTAEYIKSNRQVTCDPLNNSTWKTKRVWSLQSFVTFSVHWPSWLTSFGASCSVSHPLYSQTTRMLCILFRFFKEFLVTVVEFKKCLIVHTIRSIRHMLVCSQVPIWSTRKKEQTSVDSGTFLIFPFIFLGGAQDDEYWQHPSRNRPSGRPTPATSPNPTVLSTNCILSSLCLNLLEGQAGCWVWVLCFPLQRSQHLPPVCWWKYQKVFAFSSSLNASDLSSPWLLRILAYTIWPTTSIKTFPPTSLSSRELKYFFPPPFSPLAYRKTGQRWGHMHSLLPAHLRWASQVSTKQLTKQFLNNHSFNSFCCSSSPLRPLTRNRSWKTPVPLSQSSPSLDGPAHLYFISFLSTTHTSEQQTSAQICTDSLHTEGLIRFHMASWNQCGAYTTYIVVSELDIIHVSDPL